MSDATDKKSETPSKDAETENSGAPSSEELTVPSSARIPIEALLQLPPPTQPAAPVGAGSLMEMAAMGYEEAAPPPEMEPEPGAVDGSKLRDALRQTPEALNKLTGFSPRNLAKDTVGRGIDAALEAGGLRTPTRHTEPQ